jgi:ABC-type dipeptide/oligopeptide/nickel transport system ATPase component
LRQIAPGRVVEVSDVRSLFRDLSVVPHVCDRVAVMYVGKLTEVANADEPCDSPRHPCTAPPLREVGAAASGNRGRARPPRGLSPGGRALAWQGVPD